MACDPSSLVAESACINCSLTHKQILAALLFVAATNAGMSTNPTVLMAESACIQCGMTEKQILAALLYVNCAGGGGGAGGGLVGTGSPQGAVTANSGTGYLDTATGNFWWKASGTGTNTGWLELIAS